MLNEIDSFGAVVAAVPFRDTNHTKMMIERENIQITPLLRVESDLYGQASEKYSFVIFQSNQNNYENAYATRLIEISCGANDLH